MMSKIGFTDSWVGFIMQCICTVSYSINLNGIARKDFIRERGLRQGDRLRPFLFLICSEGLSTLMRLASEEGNLRGVRVSRRGPQISHLLFADDCILFGEAIDKGTETFENILKEYEVCLGQCVNYGNKQCFLVQIL